MVRTSNPHFFRTIYIVNAKGSGVGEKRCTYSFTVDATIYTFAPIDTERYEAMASMCHELSEWIIDEFGFRNTMFNTMGSEIDAKVSKESSRGIGFYFCELSVEDVVMAKGDYRSRSDISVRNVEMLIKSCERESYSIRDCKVIPRVAFDTRLHIPKIVSESIRRAFERKS